VCSAFATKRLLCGLLDEVQVGSDKGCPELAQIWVNADGGEILGFGFGFGFLILCQRRFGEVLGEGIRLLGSWGNSLSFSGGRGAKRGRERDWDMAQAMRVMQVVAICGSKAALLQGFSQNLDAHVALGRPRKFHYSGVAPSCLRAFSQLKDQEKSETAAVVAPATIASTLLVNANAANALTGEDVTGAFYKVSMHKPC
jgi:hypothetical protein